MDVDEKGPGLGVVLDKEGKNKEVRGEVLPEGLQHGTHEEKVCQCLLTAKRQKPGMNLTSTMLDLNRPMNLFTAPGSVFPIYIHGGPCS